MRQIGGSGDSTHRISAPMLASSAGERIAWQVSIHLAMSRSATASHARGIHSSPRAPIFPASPPARLSALHALMAVPLQAVSEGSSPSSARRGSTLNRLLLPLFHETSMANNNAEAIFAASHYRTHRHCSGRTRRA